MIPKKKAGVFWVAMVLAPPIVVVAQENGPPLPVCNSALRSRFTPPAPVLGRYEACRDARPLAQIAASDWAIEALDPLDVFGVEVPVDRTAVARLYRGTRAQVARRWLKLPGRFEAITYISPYPNPTLSRLEDGTLVIRWTCDREAHCDISRKDVDPR